MKRIFIFILLLGTLVNSLCFGQPGIKQGATIENIAIIKLLNSSSHVTTFSQLQNKITILDFFGTWCTPCLRALPNLSEIKKKFDADLSVILVSNETEKQLNKFINKQINFTFPIILDDNNQWNDLFQPPSLPYTVVINKYGRIIEITEAEAITELAIKKWLSDSSTDNKLMPLQLNKTFPTTEGGSVQSTSNVIVQLSQDFIYKAKSGEPVKDLSNRLGELDPDTLIKSLQTDLEKEAFWINLYNGYTQSLLTANPGKFKNRNTFYKSKQILVAGQMFSLDQIEHGILRHSKIKWSLGHLNKLFPSSMEKNLRVKNLDYRIHFALNCGAKSCPPIAFYNPQTLDKQLDLATMAYLTGEATYSAENNIIALPAFMSWFRADFGGKKGMRKILKQYNIIPAGSHPKIKFKSYDWTLTLNNYRT